MAANESPVGQLLRKLVPLVQDLGEMIPRLTQLLRSGVGGNTRAGTCDFLGNVAAIRPHAAYAWRTARSPTIAINWSARCHARDASSSSHFFDRVI